MELRKCFILVEQEIKMEDLKAGDVFRFNKASEDDIHIDENQYYLAETDSYREQPEGNHGIQVTPIHFAALHKAKMRIQR